MQATSARTSRRRSETNGSSRTSAVCAPHSSQRTTVPTGKRSRGSGLAPLAPLLRLAGLALGARTQLDERPRDDRDEDDDDQHGDHETGHDRIVTDRRPRRESRPAREHPATMGSTPPRSALPALCARLADAPWFQMAIVAIIVGNAVVLGLETYDAVVDEAGDLLHWLDRVFLAIFVFELGVRIAAYGRTPWRFFRNGWNVFDFVIVAVAFVPGLAGLDDDPAPRATAPSRRG